MQGSPLMSTTHLRDYGYLHSRSVTFIEDARQPAVPIVTRAYRTVVWSTYIQNVAKQTDLWRTSILTVPHSVVSFLSGDEQWQSDEGKTVWIATICYICSIIYCIYSKRWHLASSTHEYRYLAAIWINNLVVKVHHPSSLSTHLDSFQIKMYLYSCL